MSHKIEDQRTDTTTPLGYLVVTDQFLSGWGPAPNRSLFAIAYYDADQADALEIAAKGRSELTRPRLVASLKADGTPKVKLQDGDHLSIKGPNEAPEFYKGAAAHWMN